VKSAQLSFPENAATPIAAEIRFGSDVADGELTASLDWRRTESEEWTIAVETADGSKLNLVDGGSRLFLNGEEQVVATTGEYADIYREFVDLIDERRSSVDVRPQRLVADCLLIGGREIVESIRM